MLDYLAREAAAWLGSPGRAAQVAGFAFVKMPLLFAVACGTLKMREDRLCAAVYRGVRIMSAKKEVVPCRPNGCRISSSKDTILLEYIKIRTDEATGKIAETLAAVEITPGHLLSFVAQLTEEGKKYQTRYKKSIGFDLAGGHEEAPT